MPNSLKTINHYTNKFKASLALVCLVFASVFASQGVLAQGVKVSATLDSTLIFIGGQVDLKLEVSQPIDAQVIFPAFAADTIISPVEIVERGQVDTTTANNRLVLSQLYRITSFDSGLHYIPPIELEVIEAESKSIAKSNAISLMVVNPFQVVNPEDGVVGIKGPIDTPFRLSEWSDYFKYGGIIILVLGLLAFLYFKYKHKFISGAEPVIKQAPLEPAHIIAIRELNRIKESKVWEKNQEKKYYTELTDTLRTYIEQRFNVTAMEQTSDEILDSLKSISDIDKEAMKEMDQVLKLADLVKFAKFNPLPDENNMSIKNAYSFVNQTKHKEIETSEEKPEESTSVKAEV